MVVVNVVNPETKEIFNYYLEPKLRNFLERKVKTSLEGADKDYVLAIDGYEGSGKSTFAVQMARYVDPTLNLNNVCMTADEFKQAIITARKGQAVIYDEAVTGLSSGDSISRIGKLLKSMMMQMRQKNLFVIIILPTIFELNKYAILARSKSFFHVYESKGERGYYLGFNRKDARKLYFYGKKTYSYKVRSRFMGRFYGKFPLDVEAYKKKKAEALFKADEEKKEVKTKKDMLLAKLLIRYKEETGLGDRKLVEDLSNSGLDISRTQIRRLMSPMGHGPTCI